MNKTNESVNQNGAGVNPPVVVVKNRVGRPRNPNCVRSIFLELDTFKPRQKGKPTNGKEYLHVTCQRSISNAEYVHGVTPTFSQTVVKVNRPVKVKTVTVVNTTPVIDSPAPVVPVAPVVSVEVPA